MNTEPPAMARHADTVEGVRGRSRLRAAWCDHAALVGERDKRIAGVWLFGSEAAGTSDELSDIDIFFAFAEPAQLDHVPLWLARFGPVMHACEDRYNAPDNGRFFTAAYPADPLSLIVDSYWQPVSAARLGSDTRVLVDKVGVPRADPPCPTFALIPAVRDAQPFVASADRAERLDNAIGLFWSNAVVVAKHRARRIPWADDELDALRDSLTRIAEDLEAPHPGGTDPRRELRAVLSRMDQLLGPDRAAHHRAARADAYRWAEVTDELIGRGWQPTPVRPRRPHN